MAATACDADEVFRLFTLPTAELEKGYLILDLRDYKVYKKGHVMFSFCVRLSSNGKVLAEYSKAEYKLKWSNDVWVGRTVYVYGEAGLSKSHPAIGFLTSNNCEVRYYKEGFEAFSKAYPFLVSTSARGNPKHYPSQILPNFLYLGDWGHAVAQDRLEELNVKSIVTAHNNPENLSKHLGKNARWLHWTLADIDTADVASCFNKTYEFIEEARAKGHAVLVHCGAGVSRSATLVCMYLMRRFLWSAQKAKDHCISRRSVVCPNDGFWRVLCALEPTLGITSRSDPNATSGFHGADAPAPSALAETAVGGKVPITQLSASEYRRHVQQQESKVESEPPAKRQHTAAGGKSVTVTIEIRKPEGVVGGMVVGPMAPHQRVIFGRLPSCDVTLEHGSISRQHATLSVDASGALMLTDLQSGHGTKLDDVWLRANTPKQLSKGSKFLFGASTRTYVVGDIDKV